MKTGGKPEEVKVDYSEDQKNFFFHEMNKRLKNDLKKKYGADFQGVGKEVPPEVENRFLIHIKEFEEKWEGAETKKVAQVLGNPSFKKLGDIGKSQLKPEIQRILSLYSACRIHVEVIEEEDVSDEEFYRFLTEELPEHEDYFVSQEGMTTNYIYEEFHPSERLDAKECTEWFLFSLVNRDIEELTLHISRSGQLNISGRKVATDDFIKEMLFLVSGFEEILDKKVEITQVLLGENNVVVADLHIHYLQGFSVEEKIFSFFIELVRSPYGGFEVRGCSCRSRI